MTHSSLPGGRPAEPGGGHAEPGGSHAEPGSHAAPGGSQAEPGGQAGPGGGQAGPDARGGKRLRQFGWASVPVWSIGFLAFAPFLRLAIGRRRNRDWAIFAGYLLAVVAEIVVLSVAGHHDPEVTLAGGYVLLLMGVAAVHTAIAFGGDQVTAPAGSLPASSDQRNQAALATARGRMERRHEAREIASKNLVLARELRIGLPIWPVTMTTAGW